MQTDRFIVGFGPDTNEYVINGVRYIVESRYEPTNFKRMESNRRIDHRLEKYIKSPLTDLPLSSEDDTLKAGYVCSAAGKEGNHAAEEEN